jgi:hypothetical protein
LVGDLLRLAIAVSGIVLPLLAVVLLAYEVFRWLWR